ncbi:fibrinogen-like protein A [Antedon mediterranea]|uniref:fibrinogen-like protein A n=1 Tax=Antedon mediterranea TaxID=105859 RepID=UPI003AF41B66
MFYILYSFTVIFGTFVFHCNISMTSGKSCMRSAIFENQRNLLKSKEIDSLFSIRTRSATRCSLLCLSLTPDCQSFRYDVTSKSCELSGRLGLEKRGSHRAYTLRPAVKDCQGILGSGGSGLYPIAKTHRNALLVYCDMDTGEGGWTVFQRREDGSLDFYRSWEEYKNGFGNVCGEFWLGNDNIHEMTSSGKYNLRIDMKTVSGEAYYTVYDTFRIGNEGDDYTLEVGDQLNGNTVDVMIRHRGKGFTTRDVDNDVKSNNCAKEYEGAWWYYSCYICNLNGKYGTTFQCFTGSSTREKLRWSEIKIKRN